MVTAQDGSSHVVLQIEEPWVHRFEHHREDSAMTREFYVDAFNRSVRGLRQRLELWCHTCWGNPAQQRFYEAARSYAPALEHMNRLDVDVLTFECASTGGMDLEAIGRAITRPKIAIGVIDHRGLQVERLGIDRERALGDQQVRDQDSTRDFYSS